MGILTAAGLALSFLENLLPPLSIVPGAKLGLANTVTILSLYLLPRPLDAWLVALARVLLGAAFVGGGTLLYSLAGATVSLLIMTLLKATGRFSLTTVSLIGGFSHNAAQLAVAILLLKSAALLAWLPPLGAAGLRAASFAIDPIRRALAAPDR